MRGDRAENLALVYLEKAGLRLVVRNYKMPQRGGGEIDLIMQEGDGTLVFVEVRQRSRYDFGGAAASVTLQKRTRIVQAALHYLQSAFANAPLPPCRFDVLCVGAWKAKALSFSAGPSVEWFKAAFESSEFEY